MRYLLHFFTLVFLLSFSVSMSSGQQTIGLFEHSEGAYEGYTLLAPLTYRTTYLLDNCGRVVNTWESDYWPGNAAYLLEDGSLLRTSRILSPFFSGGGTGGRIERYDWNGNLTWEFDFATEFYHSHHDIEPLPNGNILVLAYEVISKADAIQAGRDSTTAELGIWSEQILEVQPVGRDTYTVVWEWHLWDHIIQDFDPSKDHFGVVSDHPELADVNYSWVVTDPDEEWLRDWTHCNSLDYNAELDQIVISNRNFHELWIIDHSTTSAEAATSSGGRSGKGGNLLYRWGNPESYQRPGRRKLFAQHDVQWIPEGYPGAGELIFFNNGPTRGIDYSSVETISPPVQSDGSYPISATEAFGPDDYSWSFMAPDTFSFWSIALSGVERLPNGNTLVCEGNSGEIWEIDSSGTEVWRYVNPVNFRGPIGQGIEPVEIDVFRARRYSPDYPGLDGRILIAGDRIELNPLPLDVCLVDSTSNPNNPITDFVVFPNPFSGLVSINYPGTLPATLDIMDVQGRKVDSILLTVELSNVDLSGLLPGLYLLRIAEDPEYIKKLLKY